MCNLTEWGTHLEVMIASKIYNRPIIVYKKDHDTGIGSLCEGYSSIDDIKNKKSFKGVRKYLVGEDYKNSAKRIYCIYLPELAPLDNNTNADPIILYNIGQTHYRVLKPKKLIHFDSKLNHTKRKTSKSLKRKTSKSPKRKTSKSPKRKTTKKPKRKTSKSPKRKTSKNPKRKTSKSPKRKN